MKEYIVVYRVNSYNHVYLNCLLMTKEHAVEVVKTMKLLNDDIEISIYKKEVK